MSVNPSVSAGLLSDRGSLGDVTARPLLSCFRRHPCLGHVTVVLGGWGCGGPSKRKSGHLSGSTSRSRKTYPGSHRNIPVAHQVTSGNVYAVLC